MATTVVRRETGLLGAVEGDLCNRVLQEVQLKFYGQVIK
jgi:hypothetical protein